MRFLRHARRDLQQSMKFVQMLDNAKGHPTRMITGDSEILRRARRSEPYLTKSEVRLRVAKPVWELDEYRTGCASDQLRDAGFRS